MTFEEKLRQAFNAGLKCNQEHPDDDSYDQVHFERVLKLLDQNTLPPSSPTATAEEVNPERILFTKIIEASQDGDSKPFEKIIKQLEKLKK